MILNLKKKRKKSQKQKEVLKRGESLGHLVLFLSIVRPPLAVAGVLAVYQIPFLPPLAEVASLTFLSMPSSPKDLTNLSRNAGDGNIASFELLLGSKKHMQ